MNILIMTNTWLPHVGGVARSVEAFTSEFRRQGHRVLVVAPEFENMPVAEVDVIRVPAIQHFNGSDFSVPLAIPGDMHERMLAFEPDIVHAQHPFLLGAVAQRLAYVRELPLVFTHHTMYEHYTHYVPADSAALKRFVIRLSTSYANLCDHVFAPSAGVSEVLRERGVVTPIDVLPTGVDTERFKRGSGTGFRAALDIPPSAFVVGHVGRLAPEKNLELMAGAVADFLQARRNAHFLLVGAGPMVPVIQRIFRAAGVDERTHIVGALGSALLVSAYRAMDVFAFTSTSETQGMVLSEAMAAGVPVVGIDAPGVTDVVVDGINGRLLPSQSRPEFTRALEWIASRSAAQYGELERAARGTAEEFSIQRMASKALSVFRSLRGRGHRGKQQDLDSWMATIRAIEAEWRSFKRVAEAVGAAVTASNE